MGKLEPLKQIKNIETGKEDKLNLCEVSRSLPKKESETIEELKQVWVEVINDFDSYEDKKEWRRILTDLTRRIKANRKR